MLCLRKCIVKALAKSKPEYENLLEKDAIPDFRILLMGRRDSGKTTFLKQARKKYSVFTESECLEFRDEIVKVVYKTVAELVAEMKQTKSQCDVDLEGKDIREIVKESEASIPTASLPNNHFETIKQFWKSASVKKCCENTENTNGGYFLNNIARIANVSYIPTVQDIMQVNTPSQAVDTQLLKIHGIKFEVTDTPALSSKLLSQLTDKKYDFIVYFMSLSQFRTAKTRDELRELSENIASIKAMIDGLMSSASILLYFTQTQEYMHTQRSQTSKHDDYLWIAKDRVMRNFSRFIESVPNRVYNHFEDTNKLTNMKLVYELIKHQAIIKNLKQIHCSS